MIDSILPFVFAHVLLVVGLLYTKPNSGLRYPITAAIVTCCFISVRSAFSLGIPGQAGGQYIYGMMMSSSHWLLLAKLSPATETKPGRDWPWAMDMLCSARWGISPKMLPSFSDKDRSYIPSRAQFLLRRTWDLIWTVTLIYLARTYTLNIFQDDFTWVSDGFLHRITEVEGREWVIRIYIALTGKLMPYLALRAGHSAVSIIAIACGDSPERYPPLFGSVLDAYNVRRFYTRFWHLLIRKSFTSHSIFIVNNVFRVTPFTPLSRYLITFGAFFMSAGMHIFVAPDVALKCALWPQFRYYFTIAGAIILEDVVSTSLKSLTRNKASKDKPAVSKKKISSQEAKTSAVEKTTDKTGLNQRKSVTANSSAMNGSANKTQKVYEPSPRDDRAPLWLRIPGYVWVLAFEVWSTSKFLFLTQQCFATL